MIKFITVPVNNQILQSSMDIDINEIKERVCNNNQIIVIKFDNYGSAFSLRARVFNMARKEKMIGKIKVSCIGQIVNIRMRDCNDPHNTEAWIVKHNLRRINK